MRALFRRFRQASTADVASGVTFDDARSAVCDTACRANAAVDRVRTSALSYR